MSQRQQGLRKLLDPFSNGFLWIAAVEMSTPWIGVVPRTILQFDLLRATNKLCGRAGNHCIWIDVFVHGAVGTYQGTFLTVTPGNMTDMVAMTAKSSIVTPAITSLGG